MLILCQLLHVFSLLYSIFYAFSGTNLLTRCQSVSSCFLLFLYFRKVVMKIFSELDETKAEVPIFLSLTRSPEGTRRGPGRQPHVVAAHPPWPRGHVVWAPWAPTDIALPPIYSFLGKTLSTRASIHEKFRSRRHRQP